MIRLIILFTLLSFPTLADDYAAGSGEPVTITVSAEVVGDASVFEITEDTLRECEDPDNTNPNCSLLIYEEVENEQDSR